MPYSILLETWLLSNPKLSCWLIHCSSPMMISTLKSSYPLPLLTPWHRKPLFSLPLLRNNLSREYSPNQSFLPLHSFNFYQGYFALFFHCLSAFYAADWAHNSATKYDLDKVTIIHCILSQHPQSHMPHWQTPASCSSRNEENIANNIHSIFTKHMKHLLM